MREVKLGILDALGLGPKQEKPEGPVVDAVVGEETKRELRKVGLPTVPAGANIMNVPCMDPSKEGAWADNREVITVSHITAYTPQNPDHTIILELDGGYLLVSTGGRGVIMESKPPTISEETRLDTERQQALEFGDDQMPDFRGRNWVIHGVFGDNEEPLPGEADHSYIEVLSVHSKLGQSKHLHSILPPELLEGGKFDYADLRAASLDDDELLMFVFFTGGRWNLYVGRFLTDVEISQLQGV